MDHRLNNEAFISCVIAKIIEDGEMPVSVLTALVPLLLDDKARHALHLGKTLIRKDTIRIGESYQELLVHIMNSILILTESGCAYLKDENLYPSTPIIGLCSSIQQRKSMRLENIIAEMDASISFVRSMDIISLYHYLKISL